MEQIVIRNLPEETKATAGLSGEDVPMSILLAADTGHDIDFEPERLGLSARTLCRCVDRVVAGTEFRLFVVVVGRRALRIPRDRRPQPAITLG